LPPPDEGHNDISHAILFRLIETLLDAHRRGEAADLGKVRMEAGYRLGDGWAQPDVSVTHAGQPRERGYLQGAPAIAIEVVSPSNTARHLEAKTELYFAHGAREVWRVYDDPLRIVIDTGGHYRVLGPEDRVTTPLLSGFALTVRELLDAR
jgi:Uma2 family endonuclease